MSEFLPHLEILPAAQGRLWRKLSAVAAEFTLYGGTAIALHLSHRRSADFACFVSRTLDLVTLEEGIPFCEQRRAARKWSENMALMGGRLEPRYASS